MSSVTSGHVALDEEDAALAGRGRRRGGAWRAARLGAELGGLVRDRHRVEVDDAVDGVGPLLVVDPALDGPDVVAEVHLARGLDSGEHCAVIGRNLAPWTAGLRRVRVIGGSAIGGGRFGTLGGQMSYEVQHPGLRGTVRPPAPPDPQGGGRALGGLARPRSSTRSWSRSTASTGSTSRSPPSSCSSRPRSSSSRRAGCCRVPT